MGSRAAAPLRVLYLGPPETVEMVRDLVSPHEVIHCVDGASVDRALPSVAAILDASMREPLGADRLSRAHHLRLVVTATTGADHIDVETLELRGIPLLTLRGQHEVLRGVTAAAEHSWLLLLACARRLRGAVDHVLSGGWDRSLFPGLTLRGRTLGIVGCGRIGQWMARYAAAFGMRRIGYDPHVDPWPEEIERVPLAELLANSDVVTVHVPLDDSTRGLLGAAEIRAMRRGAILVNTSRGDVLDEAAVVAALESGHLAAIGVDVLTGEPDIAGHPLLALARRDDRVVVTPHIGGMSPDALRHVLEFSCARLVRHLENATGAAD